MPVAAFLVPMVGTGTHADPFRGKYQRGATTLVRVAILRNGGNTHEALLLIEAEQAWLDTIDADPDCRLLATAANIDDPLTALQVSNIQTFLEGRQIPADWLVAGETRRQAMRGLSGMFMFSQRMRGAFGADWKQKLVAHGVTLATEWQALPVQFQTELLETAASMHAAGFPGWGDVQAPAPTVTLRAILRSMGNRFQNHHIELAGFVL